MRTEPKQNRKKMKGTMPKCVVFILALVLLTQALAITIGAIADQISLRNDGGTSISPSGIVKLDADEITAQLKKT